MKHSSRTGKVLGIALATVVAGSVLPAFAGLGGDAASVEADIAKMKGQACARRGWPAKPPAAAIGRWTPSRQPCPSLFHSPCSGSSRQSCTAP